MKKIFLLLPFLFSVSVSFAQLTGKYFEKDLSVCKGKDRKMTVVLEDKNGSVYKRTMNDTMYFTYSFDASQKLMAITEFYIFKNMNTARTKRDEFRTSLALEKIPQMEERSTTISNYFFYSDPNFYFQYTVRLETLAEGYQVSMKKEVNPNSYYKMLAK